MLLVDDQLAGVPLVWSRSVPSSKAEFTQKLPGTGVRATDKSSMTMAPVVPGKPPEARAQRILTAPKHPDEPMSPAPRFPYYGLEHIGFTVDDVDAACAELAAKGCDIAVGPLTRSPGLRLAFVRGPEGIMVELVQSG